MCMTQCMMFHSFRRGVGRSTLIANMTALLAIEGYRVGVIDTNFQAPSLHILFGLNEDNLTYSLNDYLSDQCDIQQTVYNITSRLGLDIKGEVHFVPASTRVDDIASILKQSYDMDRLNAGLQHVAEELRLDVLLIDPQSGLNEEALYAIGISDIVIILMRPDSQDYQGTGIMIDVVRKLDVPQLLLLVNEVPAAMFDLTKVKTEISAAFSCQVAAAVPHSDDMMALDSKGLFVLRYPDHPQTELYKQIAKRLMM